MTTFEMSEKLITNPDRARRERSRHLREIKNANAAPAHCPLDMKSQFASLCSATRRNFVRHYSRALDNWVLRCAENEGIKQRVPGTLKIVNNHPVFGTHELS